MNKATCQKRHALRRIAQRAPQIDYEAAVAAIQAGKAEFYWRQSHRVTHWRYGGAIVVYDKMRKTVITVLEERP